MRYFAFTELQCWWSWCTSATLGWWTQYPNWGRYARIICEVIEVMFWSLTLKMYMHVNTI